MYRLERALTIKLIPSTVVSVCSSAKPSTFWKCSRLGLVYYTRQDTLHLEDRHPTSCLYRHEFVMIADRGMLHKLPKLPCPLSLHYSICMRSEVQTVCCAWQRICKSVDDSYPKFPECAMSFVLLDHEFCLYKWN